MRRIIAIALLALPLALTSSCGSAPESPAPADLAPAAPAPVVAPSDYGLTAIRPLYEEVRGYILASAEDMPAERYGFRPIEGVRSFGQMLGHVAGDHYWFCSRVKGETWEPDTTLERLDKEQMLVALRESYAYCDDLYTSLPADRAAEMIQFGRGQVPRLYLLNFNVTHDWEHYGNLITYLRMNGMVPPSSQQGG